MAAASPTRTRRGGLPHATRPDRAGRGRQRGRVHGQAVVDEVVLGQPDLVEAKLLRPLHLLELSMDDVLVGQAGSGLKEEERSEAHGTGSYTFRPGLVGPTGTW